MSLNPTLPTQFIADTSIAKDIAGAKKQDIELYNAWKGSGDKQALGQLMKQLRPVIYSEVRRTSGTLPEAALSAEAKKWTIRALNTYDPNKGVAISTHVMNYLPKVRRLNYKYQNSARLPENLQLQFTEFRNATSHLETTLNREPTDEEIAKELGWAKTLVTRFKGSLYEDLVESASQRPQEVSQFNTNRFLMDHIMDKLDDQEKTILLNSKALSSQQLADKLGVSISRLNYLKTKTKNKIVGIKKEIGMY